jgi:hypothetical protein
MNSVSLFAGVGGFDLALQRPVIKKLAALNANIVHTPEVTWIYHVENGSTLGMPNRW